MNANFLLGVSAVMLSELDFPEQLSLCRSLDLAYYVYRPRIIAADARQEPFSNWRNHRFDLTPQRLLDEGPRLRSEIENAGLVPFCTMPEVDTSTDVDEIEMHLRGASAGGCSRFRLSPQDFPRPVFDFEDHCREVVDVYRQVIDRAQPLGLKVVIEMHVGNMACDPGLVYQILKHFSPDALGVILDLPNLAQQGSIDPVLAISVLQPWLDHCHVGGCRKKTTGKDEFGCAVTEPEFCSLADSDIHLPAWFATLAGVDRSCPLIIEDFADGLTGAERLQRTVADTRQILSVTTSSD